MELDLRRFLDPIFLTELDELTRCQVPERAMWLMPIVGDPPGVDFGLGILDWQELSNVQTFIVQAAIE